MLDFEIIQRVTDTEDVDISLILENQTVVIIGRNGQPSERKYTIYRARFEGKALIGNIHRKGDTNQPWPEYEFNPETLHWTQRDASRKIDRDAETSKADPKALRQGYARGERLNRAELDRLYAAYPELEKEHRPPREKMSKEQRIHREEQRRANWEKLKNR